MFTAWLRQRKSDRALGRSAPETAARTNAARVPDGQRIYAIGDIHGKLALLHQLHALILDDDAARAPAQSRIVYLGDYIDRGTQSKEVIAALMAPDPKLPPAVHLRGNHEQTLLDCLDDPARMEDWRSFGGLETLMSYGVDPALLRARGESTATMDAFAERCERHLPFFQSLEYSVTFGDYFFCHAGVRPRVPLHLQSPQDLMWIRDEFLGSMRDFGAVIVHGHTPVEKPDVRSNRINIDTGAYATRVLTAVVLEGADVRFLST